MKETAISNPIIAVNKANGIKVTKNIKILVENSLIKKEDKMANSVWHFEYLRPCKIKIMVTTINLKVIIINYLGLSWVYNA